MRFCETDSNWIDNKYRHNCNEHSDGDDVVDDVDHSDATDENCNDDDDN